jgi:hypothetical protein
MQVNCQGISARGSDEGEFLGVWAGGPPVWGTDSRYHQITQVQTKR